MSRPNILFILTDDQGAWTMTNSGNKDIITPNLDKLASKGVEFENFFCASPVCSPARASILTGRIPSQHGVHDWIRSGNLNKSTLGSLSDYEIYKDETTNIDYLKGMETYTNILAKEGYNCAISGKWHLGDSINPKQGFKWWSVLGRGGTDYFSPDLIEEGKIDIKENYYVTDLVTDKAMEFLEELNKEDKPWYLSIHYTAPHSPWDKGQHPKKYTDLYKDCNFDSVPVEKTHKNQINTCPIGLGEKRKEFLTGYYGAITAVDYNIGRIFSYLEEKNQIENTLIIFTSDNGMNMGHHGIWGKGNGTFPMNLYDTSVKVPLIVSWPKMFKGGLLIDDMGSHYDIMPTLLDLLDISYYMPPNLPGRSLKEILKGEKKSNKQDEVIIFDEYGPNRMIRTKDLKLIYRYGEGEDELYNLKEDPYERNNLINNKEYKSIKEDLLKRLDKWVNKYVDKRFDASKEEVTGFGQIGQSKYYK